METKSSGSLKVISVIKAHLVSTTNEKPISVYHDMVFISVTGDTMVHHKRVIMEMALD